MQRGFVVVSYNEETLILAHKRFRVDYTNKDREKTRITSLACMVEQSTIGHINVRKTESSKV